MRMPGPAAPAHGAARPVLVSSPADAGLGLGPGRSLDSETRAFFEPRFGHDFSAVRIYDGPAAARSARRLDALAFTVGPHIAFGEGQYAPSTPQGRRVIAHELTHTLQQERDGTHRVARLSAAMCATDCTAPESAGAGTGKFTLTVFADKEGPFLGIPWTQKVGHSWVRLTDDAGTYWSYGFWPKVGYDASNIRGDADGCVHSPDGENGNPPHHPTASRTFDLTAAQFAAAKSAAVALCSAAPKYNLFGLQCTEFVRRILDAAGQAPALGFGLIWESPNALDTWIRTRSLTLGAAVSFPGGPGGLGAPSVTAQLTYQHQFYSLLGQKLRLEWISRGEFGTRLSTVSAGLGLEATTDRVFLPSAYVFGGGFLGGIAPRGQDVQQFGAGFTGGAGLQYRIDEIATVGVEYNLVKNLVGRDPELYRLMLVAGLRFW
jgi:Domain of unknown function (DUF4157)